MSNFDQASLWIVIIGLAVGSFALRFAFIGFMGGRPMPAWLMRHLRYTAVAIIPALVAPLVVWPSTTGGRDQPATSGCGGADLCCGLSHPQCSVGAAEWRQWVYAAVLTVQLMLDTRTNVQYWR